MSNVTEYQKNYGKVLNQCINIWLRENYNLSAHTKIQFCIDNLEEVRKAETYHPLQYVFLVVLIGLIVVLAAATYVDGQMNKEDTLAFYKQDLEPQPAHKTLLLCFSPIRNWYRLVSPPKTELGRDLRFILAVRYST